MDLNKKRQILPNQSKSLGFKRVLNVGRWMVDNKTMKVWALTFITLSVLFQGCMPDSLTKFKEDTQPADTVSASGGSSSGSGSSSATVDNSPRNLTYAVTEADFVVGLSMTGTIAAPTYDGVVTSFSIAPVLPTGLTLNTTTGAISGTPTVYSAPTVYTVTADNSNTATQTTTTITLATYNPPTNLRYTSEPEIILTLAGSVGLVPGNFIYGDSSSAIGTVSQVNSNLVTVKVESGAFIDTDNVELCTTIACLAGGRTTLGASAAIDKISYPDQIQVYVADASFFTKDNNVSTGYVSTTNTLSTIAYIGKVLDIDTTNNYLVVGSVKGALGVGDSVDRSSTYLAPVTTTTRLNFIYESDDAIDLKPVLESGEDVEYSISPDLDGTFNPFVSTDGSISGNQDGTTTTEVSVNGTNPAGSTSESFSMGPQIETIDQLSYGRNVLLSVLDTTQFAPSDYITSSDGAQGRVLEVIDGQRLLIFTTNGTLKKGANVDNSKYFANSKTTITEVSANTSVVQVYRQMALTVTQNVGTDPTVGDYISCQTTGGTLGRVLGVTVGTGSIRTLDVEIISGELPVAPQNCDYAATAYVSNDATIGSVADSAMFTPPTFTLIQNSNSAEAVINHASHDVALLKIDTVAATSVTTLPIKRHDYIMVDGGGGEGYVKEILGSDMIEVRITSGTFSDNDVIDVVDSSNTSNVLVDDVVTLNGEPTFLTNLYVRNITGFFEAIDNIYDTPVAHAPGSTDASFIDNDADASVDDIATIYNVYSNNLILKVASNTGFEKGMLISSEDHGSAYVNDVVTVGANNFLYVTSYRRGFGVESGLDDMGLNIDDANPYQASATTISSIRVDNSFYFMRGQGISLVPELGKGTNATYSISPTLPDGVTLNTSSGVISGTPTRGSDYRSYTVTARSNLNGTLTTITSSFNMRVIEHFSVFDKTENTSFYYMHREGQSNEFLDCSITEDQINSSQQNLKDVTCILDAAELELASKGIKFQFDSGAGVCSFVTNRPYGFWNRAPASSTTSGNIDYIVKAEGCTGGILSEPLSPTDYNYYCPGDYSQNGELPSLPNCDGGKYQQVTRTYSDTTNNGFCDTVEDDASPPQSCGGNPVACLDGPIKDLLSDAQASLGYVGIKTTMLPDQANQSDFDIKGIENLTNSNYWANYMGNNQCVSDNHTYNTSNWKNIRDYEVDTSGYGGTLTSFINSDCSTAVTTELGTKYLQYSDDTIESFLETNRLYTANGIPFVIRSIDTTNDCIELYNNITPVSGATFAPGEVSHPFERTSLAVGDAGYRTFSPNPFYEYLCLDAAEDTKARIRIVVREWDREFDGNSKIDYYQMPVTGTVIDGNLHPSNAPGGDVRMEGTGTTGRYTTDIRQERMINIGTETFEVDTIINDNEFDVTAIPTIDQASSSDQIAYIRPLNSDAGQSTDSFSELYNDIDDWDDVNSNGYYPHFSCGSSPTMYNTGGSNFEQYRSVWDFPANLYLP